MVKDQDLIFEIDLAYARTAFRKEIRASQPYIGHPEAFYTIMERPFPEENVSLEEFLSFVLDHPRMKVLIDLKSIDALPFLEKMVHQIGKDRCLVHAFIKDWTIYPEGIEKEPHWIEEDIDLEILDRALTNLNIPLIANCRGFSDVHVKENGLIDKILQDSQACSSIISCGLYYPGAILPDLTLLSKIQNGGYYPWINGNLLSEEELKKNRYIAMCDTIEKAALSCKSL